MKSAIRFLLLSCKKATELIEKRSIFGVSAIQNIQLKLHTIICVTCKSYEKKSSIIDKTIQEHYQNKINNSRLSPEKKQEIIDKFSGK